MGDAGSGSPAARRSGRWAVVAVVLVWLVVGLLGAVALVRSRSGADAAPRPRHTDAVRDLEIEVIAVPTLLTPTDRAVEVTVTVHNQSDHQTYGLDRWCGAPIIGRIGTSENGHLGDVPGVVDAFPADGYVPGVGSLRSDLVDHEITTASLVADGDSDCTYPEAEAEQLGPGETRTATLRGTLHVAPTWSGDRLIVTAAIHAGDAFDDGIRSTAVVLFRDDPGRMTSFERAVAAVETDRRISAWALAHAGTGSVTETTIPIVKSPVGVYPRSAWEGGRWRFRLYSGYASSPPAILEVDTAPETGAVTEVREEPWEPGRRCLPAIGILTGC